MTKSKPNDAASFSQLVYLDRDLRDARLHEMTAAEHLMLIHLAWRINKNYTCWPSIQQLVRDTGLNEYTLKRAGTALVNAKLVKRRIRKNRSNLWWINHKLLGERAEANREADRRAKEAIELEEAAAEQAWDSAEPDAEPEQQDHPVLGYKPGVGPEEEQDEFPAPAK
jgi:hypothetical protein